MKKANLDCPVNKDGSMRTTILLASLFISSTALATVPHMDLEMTSAEYRVHLQNLPRTKQTQADDPAISASLKIGERLSQWITVINNSRPEASAIRLTSEGTRRGIPIDAPSIYNPASIKTGLEQIMKDLPEAMRSVLFSSSDLPASSGMDDETFIKHARLLDRNYQSAARYKSVNIYRSHYVRAAAKDVRGYYFLKKNRITKEVLSDVRQIQSGRLNQIKDALARICVNASETLFACARKVDEAVKTNTLAAHYERYITNAIKNWDTFFQIPNSAARRDVQWNGSVMSVPFNTPHIPKFVPYLQNNIQDEFRFGDWKLLINFGTFSNGPLLVFKPGVVPHVNGLGGNQIVMDSNQPIEEYESQWTIRHEFGHVIGLPDCYHEFYDTKLAAYVNYQLDTTDLMCSRAGNMNERIYLELKKVYNK
jgi:hypothetical protein